MIHIVFYEQGGIYYGFEETGHSGFDEAGHDIVCAAVSAMTMFLINTVEVGYACDIQYAIDEKTTDVRILAASAFAICWRTTTNISMSNALKSRMTKRSQSKSTANKKNGGIMPC